MLAIIQSEFFWGIIVGLALTIIGSFAQAKLTKREMVANQRQIVVQFSIDVIRNLQKVISEMDKIRERAKAIHHDYLALIDIEIQVYGRNREHMIRLPQAVRDDFRAFVTDCAVKRAEITAKLEQFYHLNRLADGEGRPSEAGHLRQQAAGPLAEAQAAADRLVTISNGGGRIIDELSKVK